MVAHGHGVVDDMEYRMVNSLKNNGVLAPNVEPLPPIAMRGGGGAVIGVNFAARRALRLSCRMARRYPIVDQP